MENANKSVAQSRDNDVKKQLNALLEIEGIKSVYFVDEANVVDVDAMIGIITQGEYTGKKQEIGDVVRNLLPTELNYPSVSDYVRQIWEELGPIQQSALAAQIANIVNPERGSDLTIVSKLQEYFDNLVLLTPNQWKSQKSQISKNKTKVLVLFDEELKDSFPDKGHKFIEEIVEEGWSIIVPIIFSQSISTYSEEITWRNNLVEQSSNSLKKEDFFALSKSRQNDLGTFVDGLKKAMLNNYVEQIKNASLDIFDSAMKLTKQEITNLDPYHFDDVILKTSAKEGVWEPFTLLRILRIIQEDSIHNEMVQTSYVRRMNAAIETAKRINEIDILKPSGYQPYIEKQRLRHKELFLSGNIINSLNYPLENGDIFEVQTLKGEEFFILVAQECDLMVRNNGSRNSNVGTLLPLEKIGLDDLSNSKKESTIKDLYKDVITTHAIRYYDENQDTIAKIVFKNALHVSIDFLDLSVLNKNGRAQIFFDPSSEVILDLSQSWVNRYKLLKEKFENLSLQTAKYQELVKKADSKIIGRWIRRFFVRKDFTQKLQTAILPPFSFPENIVNEVSFSNKSFELGIRRIQRLRDLEAKYLLEKFTRYQSRRADLHDFAK